MVRKATFIILTVLSVSAGNAQIHPSNDTTHVRLVVGIIVDQMRQEYLYRFAPKFGEGGFMRLMNDGFMLQNAHYNYVPTFTGPGHASVYTGTTPAIHGIIGNEYYDKITKKDVNCVQDARYKPIGSDRGIGDVSPSRLLSSTITDELKLATQLRAKVIGLSIKDRGAILPAGHMPDGAYWYDGATGRFISSTYYHAALPKWVDKFNAKNLAEKYLSKEWNTLLPIARYSESGADNTPYEGRLKGKETPVFPYELQELRKINGDFELLPFTPFGDDLLTEMAKATIAGELMGNDETTDFLTISYSSPDIVGHSMGPNSIEIEDVYLRLDRNIKDLLDELDKKVGAGKYLVFLTGDHAVADVPKYLKDHSIPAEVLNTKQIDAGLNDFITPQFPGRQIIENISNYQVFLNQDAFTENPKTGGVDLMIVTELITRYLMMVPGIAQVYSGNILKQGDYKEAGIKGMIVRGYNQKRSGDIVFITEPGYTGYSGLKGTTHGSPYTYDTHVPVLFYGKGIRKGSSVRYHPVTDIAPTLSMLMGIKFPSGCTGQPIAEILDNRD